MNNFKLTFLSLGLLVAGIQSNSADFCAQFQDATISESEYKLVTEIFEQKIKALSAREDRVKSEGFLVGFPTYGIEGVAKCKIKSVLKRLKKENPKLEKEIKELVEKDMDVKEQKEIEASLATAHECKNCFEYLRAKMIVEQFEKETDGQETPQDQKSSWPSTAM